MGPGISDLWPATRITFCPLVGRFHLLMIRITVTPQRFDIGVISMITTCWSVGIWVFWSCHLRALPRGEECQHIWILWAHASPVPCSDMVQYIFGTVARAARSCLLRRQCMFPWSCWRSKGRIRRHWQHCWGFHWCCTRSLRWHCTRFCRHHRRFWQCVWRVRTRGWASLWRVRVTGFGSGAAGVFLLRFEVDAHWARCRSRHRSGCDMRHPDGLLHVEGSLSEVLHKL